MTETVTPLETAGARAVTFVPLKQFHVKQVLLQKEQRLFKGDLSPAALAAMAAGRQAEAVLVGDRCISCGGILDEQEGRGRAWALVGESMSYAMWPAIVARMRAQIDAALHPETGWAHRVWAETIYDWPDGHRLLLHIGMQFEGLTRGTFGPGKHGAIYGRVREDVAALPVRVRALVGTAERCLWEDSMPAAVSWAVEEARRAERGGSRWAERAERLLKRGG